VHKVPNRHLPGGSLAGIGISKKSNDLVMYYNPEGLMKLERSERCAVIKHEFLHPILGHLSKRFPETEDPEVHTVQNIAMDLAINCFLESEFITLKEELAVPGNTRFKNYPPFKTAEWYYEKLLKDPEMKDIGKGCRQLDIHDWKNLPEEVRDLIEQRIRAKIAEAANDRDVLQRGWGTVPESIKKGIKDLIYPNVDCEAVLRMFVQNSIKTGKKSTFCKVNRRYPGVFPGHKIIRRANILVTVDQSGSVGTTLLSTMVGFMHNLSKIASFTVAAFDTEVDEESMFVWKQGTNPPVFRTRSGGTDFDAPTRYFNEHAEYDGLIILTDMQAPVPIPVRNGARRLWITDQSGFDNTCFNTNEKIIILKV